MAAATMRFPRPERPHSAYSLRGGLDQRHDAGADGLGESIPRVDDGGQSRVGPKSIVGLGGDLGGILGTFQCGLCRLVT